MGCDYFIIKQLEITHINSYDSENDITCIEYLQVNYKPRILFQNENVENKYKKMIRDKIGDDIIINIIKKEVRYFR
jgi:hypothetical protein